MALRYALLGLLSREELSGYDLAQRFSQQVSHFWEAHHTQIYRELQKLEEEGLVNFHRVEQQDRPDKKMYELTDRGMEQLLGWLAETPKPPKKMKHEVLLRVSMFHLIPPERAIAFLQESKAYHLRVLEGMEMWGQAYFAEHKDEDTIGETLTLDFGMRFMKTWVEWCDFAIGMFESRKK